MAATAKIKWNFTFDRRGGQKAWTTSTHLDTPISTLAEFQTVVDHITSGTGIVWENCFRSNVIMTGAEYYAPGSDVAHWSYLTGATGSESFGSAEASSDSCALWKWSTDQRSTKNHPIYLWNYVHGVMVDDGLGNGDLLTENQAARMTAFCNRWVTGWTIGGVTYKRAGPRGAVAQDVNVSAFVHHRDFRK